MRTAEFVRMAKEGRPVYISDVRRAFDADKEKSDIHCILDLLEDGKQSRFVISIPPLAEGEEFIKSYVYARIYNVLSSLGGKKLNIYIDTKNKDVLSLTNSLSDVFGIGAARKDRIGYGRCINVIERMLGSVGGCDFNIDIQDIKSMPAAAKEDLKPVIAKVSYVDTAKNLKGTLCGIDIGGTDIKMAVSIDNNIEFFKEYDWFPANFTRINQLIDPVLLLVKLVRHQLTFNALGGEEKIGRLLKKAMEKTADNAAIQTAVDICDEYYGQRTLLFDGIGLCFPDVVIKNKIVGGEVYKTRGIRDNGSIDYEKEFARLTHLNEMLQPHCAKGGIVKMTNDGPMAAYTAAIEMAFGEGEEKVENGVFAHTLGTELGTGWVDEHGEIPEIPLEVYNFIIDLGSFPEKQYQSDDLRSINNFNTGLPGTLQKYTSQSGVFRLAIKYFAQERKDLYDELIQKGFIAERPEGLFVPITPIDQRKPFLEHMMALPERENCAVCKRIFEDLGEFLAVTWLESEDIMHPKAKQRYLFGRLVKNRLCFELMQKGARRVVEGITLIAADNEMANTPLMKQLKNDPHYTIAQFAQAIGAIYYAMSGVV